MTQDLGRKGEPMDKKIKVNLNPWNEDIFYVIADIFRTSPMNPNYPHGYDCNKCEEMNLECLCEGDGWECNFTFAEWLKGEVIKRGMALSEPYKLEKEGQEE